MAGKTHDREKSVQFIVKIKNHARFKIEFQRLQDIDNNTKSKLCSENYNSKV